MQIVFYRAQQRVTMKVKISIAIVVVILACFAYLRNSSKIEGQSAAQKAAYVMENNGCLACHDYDAKAPWYAKLPFASSLITGDIMYATRSIDLRSVVNNLKANKPVTEVDLNKIEYAVKANTMPPFAYSIAHWSSHLTAAEKDALLAWVSEARAEYVKNSDAAKEFKNEPVSPLAPAPKVDERKVKLGYALYNDKRLSADDTVSCATCHNLETGGVDRLQYSKGIKGQLGGVNAPTVFNATFHHRQFWDGRAANLEEQAGGPPLNPVEMGSTSWDQICAKLNKDEKFKKEFTAVYPDGFSGKNICDAIAEFERTLVTPNARFDKYLRGDKTALTADEIRGYELFKAAKCANCHAGANLGGLTFEYMGVLKDYFADRGNVTEADKGLYNFQKDDKNIGKFKVPTLRNVELTPPYFHDGTVTSLKEAAAHMVKYQAGVKLSEQDIEDIVKFLYTLTGEYNGKPLSQNVQK